MSYITLNEEFGIKKRNTLKKDIPLDALKSNFSKELHAEGIVTLFGFPLVNTSLTKVAQSIVKSAALGEKNIVEFINAHCINNSKKDEEYRDALNQADVILPDGAGIKLAGKLAKTDDIPNLNGTDLFPLICQEASKSGQALYLLGGESGIAAATSKNMRNEFPGLEIVGTQHGFFDPDQENEIIADINASGASILFVGMGVPHQEKWIARNRQKINAPIILGVGGLFDYYSGRIARAPLMMRKMQLEWVWRFMQEPKRLLTRYTAGNAIFLCHAIAHAFKAAGYAERCANASKRNFDLAIALCALTLLAPIAAAICLFIAIEDRGNPFFKQTRIGKNGKPFQIWKFRSMYKDAEARKASLTDQNERDSVCFKMKNDPRITRIGKLIRRTSMDELPQILNVLLGNMSIVGPRPALPNEVLIYGKKEQQRLNGKPGITCTWQVSGRADIPFEKQVELDVEYLKDTSLTKDFKLILQTIPAVITGKGAY